MKALYTLIISVISITITHAQEEDLLSLLGEEDEINYTIASFKTSRVIHGHSLETTKAGVLDFKVSHRFGMLNMGFEELFGLDNAMMRFGFEYGLSDVLTIGVGRNSFQKIYDGFVKYKFIRQSTGERVMPISAAVLVATELVGTKTNPDPNDRGSSRFAHIYQLIVGRKFSEGFTLQVMPTLVHRNFVEFDEENDVFAIGIGVRQKLSSRIAITAEYYIVPSDQLPQNQVRDYHNSLAFGFDIETGGHVFQLHFTNSTSMAHRGFITETAGDWTDGGIHFGFNISRVFTISKQVDR